MIILLSPAKSLDFESPVPDHGSSSPAFPAETNRLVKAASRLSKPALRAIMPLSDKLIELNYRRYRGFAEQPQRAAIHAFDGDVYRGFEAGTMDEAGMAFAQDHLRILSGLYGALKPLDAIRPYRLEMGTRWAPRHKSLVAFWGDRISARLADDLAESGGDCVLNLASQEYFAAAEPGLRKRGIRIIDVDFRQDGPDGPRFISFAAKRARGMAARYMCENRFDRVNALKDFAMDGYAFDPAESTADSWRFTRA
ncbi:MAG: YaaA family protein [Blastomonas sp.]